MKTMITALLACMLLACGSAAQQPSIAVSIDNPEAIAFVNVSVLPMDSERVLTGQTVVVEGERIVAIGPTAALTIPAETLQIDGTGKFLLPGLAEMHGHIPSVTDDETFIENVLFLYVANGITTVRGMLGWPGQLALRTRANAGELVAPTLYLAGPSFNGGSVDSPEQAIEMVRRQKAEGWNLLKIHPGLTLEEYDAMARTANEEGIRFGGHVPADVGLVHALKMRQETFDHLDGYVEYLQQFDDEEVDAAALAEIVRLTKEAGAWVVPTMALWETLYGTADLDAMTQYPELKYFPPEAVANWANQFRQRLNHPQFDAEVSRRVIDARMQVLRALNEGGADILMGTDAPQQFSVPGFSLHRELEIMEAAGMTPYQILRSGTANVGRYFANEDTFGTVAAGQRADLLLVDANPLDDIAHLQRRAGVMVRGRWLPETEIQQRLAKIAAGYAQGDS